MNVSHETSALTARQRAFCEHYAQLGNGAAAARQAGYSARTARQQASRLLTKANVCQQIQAFSEEMKADRERAYRDIIARLREVERRALASDDPKLSSALRALSLEARIAGLDGVQAAIPRLTGPGRATPPGQARG
jgi:phage terminase small subunit